MVVVAHTAKYRFRELFLDRATDTGAVASPLALQGIERHLNHGVIQFSDYAGGLGVQFFFVISGFIITTLLMREYEGNGRVSLSAFYVRRAFRILPPLWLVLGVTFGAAALGYILVDFRSFPLASAFLCDIWNCQFFLGHTWSLAVEEQFYIVWPTLLVGVSFRAVPAISAALLVAFLLLAQSPNYWASLDAMSFACIAAGCLCAASATVRSFLSRVAALPILAAALMFLLLQPFIPQVFRGQVRLEDAMHPALIGLAIIGSLRYRAPLESFRVVRWLAGLGLVSYGLYLWQQIFLARPSFYLVSMYWGFLLFCPAAVLLSFHYLEKPLMRIGARLSRRLTETGILVRKLS